MPEDILDRTPSVRSREELSLLSYRVLDEIVERFIEHGEGVEEVVAAGFDRRTAQESCAWLSRASESAGRWRPA